MRIRHFAGLLLALALLRPDAAFAGASQPPAMTQLPAARDNLGGDNSCNPATDPGKNGSVNADPTGVALSDVAFTYCLAATVNGAPANLYLPSGVYNVSQSIVLTTQNLYGPGATIETSAGISVLTLGDATHEYTGQINIGQLAGPGSGGTTDAITVANASRSHVTIGVAAYGFRYGIRLYTPLAGKVATENHFDFALLKLCNTGVYYDPGSASGNDEQGNIFNGSILACAHGFVSHALSGASADNLSIFTGTIDNAAVGGSQDIEDGSGDNLFFMAFARPAAVTLGGGSFLLNQAQVVFSGFSNTAAPVNPAAWFGLCNSQDLPTPYITGWSICNNLSSGGAEVDLFNTGANTDGFDFRQLLGGGLSRDLLWLHGDGGAVLGAATGASKGAGTLNAAAAVYDNGTAPSGSAGTGYVRAGSPSITDPLISTHVISTAQLDATNNTTIAIVPGLSVPLVAGGKYQCRGHLTGTSGSAGGVKMALVGTSGLSVTSLSITAQVWAGSSIGGLGTVTSLGSVSIGNTVAFTDIYFEGALVVNAGGTINVEVAQQASNGTTTSVLVNSTLACDRAS